MKLMVNSFTSARFILLLFFVLLSGGGISAQTETEKLTTARSIRDLSAENAEAKRPVDLTATVTLASADRTIFLQDATGGTFIRSRTGLPTVHSGQILRVEGITYPGLYVPGIDAERISVVGESELPSAAPLSYEQLASGQFHYQWTEVTGIVRRALVIDHRFVVTLALGDGRIDLLLPTAPDPLPLLVDARVRAFGLAAGSINDRRQLVAPHLRMRSLDDLHVIEAQPSDPFAIEATPTQELLRFAPNGRVGHRVKVRGIVTHADAESIFLRDGDRGLRTHGEAPPDIVPGAEIEVLGFPEMGRFTAYLDDAEVRIRGKLDPPSPAEASPKAILAGTFDADLVRLEATLLEILRTPDAQTLMMKAGDTVFGARLPRHEELGTSVTPGSRLRLTGVCSIAHAELQPQGYRSAPRSFELLLRSANDIQIIQAAPWWTQRRLALASAGLLALVVVALAWAALLRRQVRRQTAIIQQKVQTETVIEERQRIAREFHDSLQQELIGLSLRLDALATRVTEEKPRDLLDAARRLLQRLQSEARGFVWDLRAAAGEPAPLIAQIRQAITPAAEAAGLKIELVEHGSVRRLPALLEHNLVRIAQEAVTNAIKHGSARNVNVTLDFESNRVLLFVRDDGTGFEPQASELAGHFGMAGMRERAQKMGGTCTFSSSRAEGTSVEISVPIP